MPVRASDSITLAVLASITYARTYYLLQASNLAAPAKPTTNPPAAAWVTTEPNYTAGSTTTLYTVSLTVYGTAGFEYGDVQKSSSYEAAKQAYNLADTANDNATSANGRITISNVAPTVANGSGKAVGSIWYQRNAGNEMIGIWEWSGAAWGARTLTDAVLTNINAATISLGTLSAARIGTKTITADKMVITASDNLLLEPGFDQGLASWGALAGMSRNPTGGRDGTGCMQIVNSAVQQATYNLPQDTLQMETNSAYRMSYWVYDTAGIPIGGTAMGLRVRSSAGTFTTYTISNTVAIAANTWTKVSGTVKIAVANAVTGSFYLASQAGNGTGVMRFDAPAVTRASNGELIVDGTIEGVHIKSQTVDTDNLKAGAIDSFLVTGLNMQTVETALRGIKINNTGILAYSSTGVNTVNINATTGAVSITGLITATGGSITGNMLVSGKLQTLATASRGVELDATGLRGYTAAGAKTFDLLSSTGILTATNVNISGAITATSGSFTGTVTATAGTISGNMLVTGRIQTSATASRGIELTAASLTAYNSTGTPTFSISSSTGAVNMTGQFKTAASVGTGLGGTIIDNAYGLYSYGSTTNSSAQIYNGALYLKETLAAGAGGVKEATFSTDTVYTKRVDGGVTDEAFLGYGGIGVQRTQSGIVRSLIMGPNSISSTEEFQLSSPSKQISLFGNSVRVTSHGGADIVLEAGNNLRLKASSDSIGTAGALYIDHLWAESSFLPGNLQIDYLGKVTVNRGGSFAMAAGNAVAPFVNNGTGYNVPVTFPPGRFTVPPNVTANADSSRITASVNGITTSGCNIRCDNWSTGGANSFNVAWQAVQMTATAASG